MITKNAKRSSEKNVQSSLIGDWATFKMPAPWKTFTTYLVITMNLQAIEKGSGRAISTSHIVWSLNHMKGLYLPMRMENTFG